MATDGEVCVGGAAGTKVKSLGGSKGERSKGERSEAVGSGGGGDFCFSSLVDVVVQWSGSFVTCCATLDISSLGTVRAGVTSPALLVLSRAPILDSGVLAL